MAKIPTKYLEEDNWQIIERGHDRTRSAVSESIFSLSNEYMGVRGFFEEGSSDPSLVGSYFNGVYEYAKKADEGAYKGIVRRTHFMVNSVNWLKTAVFAGDTRLNVSDCDIDRFTRVLDMRSGVLTRSFEWKVNGGAIDVSLSRFLDMREHTRGYQRLSFTADRDLTICVELTLDFNVLHWGKDCYFKPNTAERNGLFAVIRAETLSTKQFVTSAMQIECNGRHSVSNASTPLSESVKLTIDLKAGKPCEIVRYVTNVAEREESEYLPDAVGRAKALLKAQVETGYTGAVLRAKEYWSVFWKNSDIEIDGSVSDQQGIRFCIFQLQQTYHGAGNRNNIGAKGLTGEAYSGHAFWDTETYCLPYYLFNNLDAAKALLLYRYHTLTEAKQRAAELDCKGACYPIATLNGREACNLWQHASLQFQPSTAVAYGIRHYVKLSNDREFLFGCGAEMLVEISRFLLSRGDYNADKTHFGFYCVMGPDEFQMMVNHNTYTNFMAKKTFLYTVETVEAVQREEGAKFKRLQEKLGLTKDEIGQMRTAAEKMLILYDENTKLFEQHKGYFDLPHVDVNRIPVTDFPLYHNWSYDRIYRNDMIKQPDVLMFMLLYLTEFSEDVLRANYDFYEPRTIHESSLSPSVHSILAAQLGYEKQMTDFFSYATRLDLDDYNRNTAEGLHTTSIAAAWMNIVYGFGGLRSDGEILALNPVLPKIWKGYSFHLTAGGKRIHVSVTRDKVRLTSPDLAEIRLNLFGKVYDFTDSLEVRL